MLKTVNLQCEYQQNPIGTGAKKPCFGWVIESDRYNVLQESYRLQIAADTDFTSIFWDTGRVMSQNSAQILYEGPPLQSRTRYYFRVMITDNQNQESPWSDTAFFETAMLDSSEWKAEYITSDDEYIDKPAKTKLFRHEFELKGDIQSARTYATALGLYELYINGKRVGDAVLTPGWTDYNTRLQYQTYDITELVSKGANAAGAMVGGGWYIGNEAGWLGRQVDYGKRMALLVQIHIRYEDGSEQIILTDGSWKCIDGLAVYSEFYNGELYDARLEQDGWNMPGFDDSNWHRAEILMHDKSILTPQDGLFVKRQDVIKPLSMITTPKGERVIDFGQNLAGWVRFNVSGKAGDRVVLKHAEVLDAEGNFYTDNLRKAESKIEYILKGDESETFEPHFTFQGFRYVRIDEYPGQPRPEDFAAVVIHSDMQPAGSFSCSNDMLNQLQHNILWGLKGNFVDVPTDCPQRDERLGWTGDAQIFIRTACFLMGVEPFFKKWLRDMRACQFEDGGIPYVIPDVLTNSPEKGEINWNHSACGWGDAAVVCPWTVYLCYGDLELLREQYPMMKKWVEYIRRHAKDEAIWNTGFHYGDWVALDAPSGSYTGATSKDFLATAYYAYSTELTCRAAAVLGYKEDAAEYNMLHSKILKAFKEEFYTPSGRLAVNTQTAHVIALAFGLAPEEYKKRTVDDLAALIDQYNGCLTTGFLGTPHLCHVLSQNGRLDLAYKLLMREEYPSWLYPITKGATTIWEHWDGIKPDGSMWSADMNSFNHYAYGAIGDFLYRVVAGLEADPANPGYKNILIHPMPGGGLTYANASINSIYGKASVEWRINDGQIKIDIIVPHSSTAHIILPNAKANEVKSSAPVNVSFKACKGGAEAEIGSGVYSFSYAYVE